MAACSPDCVRGYYQALPPGGHLPPSLRNGRVGLSGDRSLRIENAFGVKMDTLMRMASAHEIAQTRKREGMIRVPLAVGQTL